MRLLEAAGREQAPLPGSFLAVAIELLRLENVGWERDTAVKPQEEPSYTLPASEE